MIDFDHEKLSLSQLEGIVQSAKHVHRVIHARGGSKMSPIRCVLTHFLDGDGFISPLNRAYGNPEKPTRSEWLRFFSASLLFSNYTVSWGSVYSSLEQRGEKSPFLDVREIIDLNSFGKILSNLRVFPASRFDVFSSCDIICADTTRYLAPLEAWVTESSSPYVRPNVEVVIDDLHGRDSGSPEGVSTGSNRSKGNKGAPGVKFNAMKTDEGITVALRVKREDETLGECITALVNCAREGGVMISSTLVDRGYSYEPIFAAILRSRRGYVAKPIDIVATVRNYTGQFNPRGPWKLGPSSTLSNATSEDDSVTAGKPFCVEGAQCALGATSSICDRKIYATVFREGGLLNCGVTMMTTREDLTFERWHVFPANSHALGKDKARSLVRVNYIEIKERLFNNDGPLVARTLRQDCQSWFLLQMGVATSTVGQMLVPVINNEAFQSSAVNDMQQAVTELTGRGRNTLTDSEKQRLSDSLSRLRVVDLRTLLTEKALPASGNKAGMVERLLKSYADGVAMLDSTDRIFARVFSKWILRPRSTSTRKAMEMGHNNEPVMLAKLASFLSDIAVAEVNICALMEIGLVVQSSRSWLDTSPDAISLVVDANEYHPPFESANTTTATGEPPYLTPFVSQVGGATSDYFKSDGNPEHEVRVVGEEQGRLVVQRLSTVCPVELKTKASSNTAAKLIDSWTKHGNGERFFRLGSSDPLVQKLSIQKDHVRQCLHH